MQTERTLIEEKFKSRVLGIKKIKEPPKKGVLLSDLVTDITDIIELLIKVVNDPDTDASLQGLEGNFWDLIARIMDDNESGGLANNMELLAARFEPFLKKIGYMKYRDTTEWNGDTISKGLKATELYNLCLGQISNQHTVDQQIPLRNLPEKLVRYDGNYKLILDFVRRDLRNELHNAKDYEKWQLMYFFNPVIAVYLFAVQDNRDFLRSRYLPEYAYAKGVIKDFDALTKRYIDLEMQEYFDMDDLSPLAEEYIDMPDESDIIDGEENRVVQKRGGKIVDIYKISPRMVIRGNPGMGKTTTLKFLACSDAIRGDSFPLYYELKAYSTDISLLMQLSYTVGTPLTRFEDYLRKGKVNLYLDGLNEVLLEDRQVRLKTEIHLLLTQYPEARVLITSRGHAYGRRDEFHLPVFDLKPLTGAQIAHFISKVFKGASVGEKFHNALQKNIKLYNLCTNIFMLTLYCNVVKSKNEIPENTGRLLQAFMKRLFDREGDKPDKIEFRKDKEKYRDLISFLAYTTRQRKEMSFHRSVALNILNIRRKEYNYDVDLSNCIEIFKELTILREHDQHLTFIHELYQEYFAAEELLHVMHLKPNLVSEISGDPYWEEPLILLRGISRKSVGLVEEIAVQNAHIAARSITASVEELPEETKITIDHAMTQATSFDSPQKSANGLLALVELGQYEKLGEILNKINRPDKEHRQSIQQAIHACNVEKTIELLKTTSKLEGRLRQLHLSALNALNSKDFKDEKNRVIEIVIFLDQHKPQKDAIIYSITMAGLLMNCDTNAYQHSNIIKKTAQELLGYSDDNSLLTLIKLITSKTLRDNTLIEETVRRLLLDMPMNLRSVVQLITSNAIQGKTLIEETARKLITQGTVKHLRLVVQLITSNALQDKTLIEETARRLIAEGTREDLHSVVQLITSNALQDKALIEDTALRLFINGSQYARDLLDVLVKFTGFEAKVLLEETARRLITQGTVKDLRLVVQLITSKAIQNKTLIEETGRRLIAEGTWEDIHSVVELVIAKAVQDKTLIEDTARKLLTQGTVKHLRLVVQFITSKAIQNKTLIEETARRLLAEGTQEDLHSVVRLITSKSLQDKALIEDTVTGLITQGTVKALQSVVQLVTSHALQDKTLIEDTAVRLLCIDGSREGLELFDVLVKSTGFKPKTLIEETSRRLITQGSAKDLGLIIQLIKSKALQDNALIKDTATGLIRQGTVKDLQSVVQLVTSNVLQDKALIEETARRLLAEETREDLHSVVELVISKALQEETLIEDTAGRLFINGSHEALGLFDVLVKCTNFEPKALIKETARRLITQGTVETLQAVIDVIETYDIHDNSLIEDAVRKSLASGSPELICKAISIIRQEPVHSNLTDESIIKEFKTAIKVLMDDATVSTANDIFSAISKNGLLCVTLTDVVIKEILRVPSLGIVSVTFTFLKEHDLWEPFSADVETALIRLLQSPSIKTVDWTLSLITEHGLQDKLSGVIEKNIKKLLQNSSLKISNQARALIQKHNLSDRFPQKMRADQKVNRDIHKRS